MEHLIALWLPILVSAAGVWVYSAMAWMVLPHHRKDHVGLPDEAGFMAAIRNFNIPPGMYGFPHCPSHSAAKDSAFMEKWKAGPAGMLNVWRPNINMGVNMVKSLLVYLLVSVLVGYIGSVALPWGTEFGKVMQVLGTAAILGYTTASLPGAIWFQASRNSVVACAVDGVVQGLITGAVFAWLWPAVKAAALM